MRLKSYVLNENMVDKAKGFLKRMSWKQATKFLKNEFDTFVEAVQEAGLEREVVSIVNKGFDTVTSDYGADGNINFKNFNIIIFI